MPTSIFFKIKASLHTAAFLYYAIGATPINSQLKKENDHARQ